MMDCLCLGGSDRGGEKAHPLSGKGVSFHALPSHLSEGRIPNSDLKLGTLFELGGLGVGPGHDLPINRRRLQPPLPSSLPHSPSFPFSFLSSPAPLPGGPTPKELADKNRIYLSRAIFSPWEREKK